MGARLAGKCWFELGAGNLDTGKRSNRLAEVGRLNWCSIEKLNKRPKVVCLTGESAFE